MRTRKLVCTECFLREFEEEVNELIVTSGMFHTGDIVCIGISGGKDSAVLAYVMNLLNERFGYGISVELVSVDEGIAGYRDASLKCAREMQTILNLPLKIVSFFDLFGVSLDEVALQVGIGQSCCTFCGVLRRTALERAAQELRASKLCTGHNADDVAETVLMNVVRGDASRLQRCTLPLLQESNVCGISRCKPLMNCFEKEIVLYAHHRKLPYFSTECTYAPQAFRGYAREFVRKLEQRNPWYVLNMIQNCQHQFPPRPVKSDTNIRQCETCGCMTSKKTCRSCQLLMTFKSGRRMIYEDK